MSEIVIFIVYVGLLHDKKLPGI